MRLTLVTAAVIALVLVVAGCGGGKKSSAPPAATTAAGATTTSAGSTTAATTTSGKATAPSFASAKNCQQLVQLAAKVSAAVQASAGNGTSSLTAEANALNALANAAPSEIRGDFATFASAFVAYAKALDKAGFKPGKTPTASQIAAITQATKSFSTTKLQAAEQHLSAWGKKNCGGLVPSTTG